MHGKVTSTGAPGSPAATVRGPGSNAVLTKEWPLQPGGLDHTYDVRGAGTLLEETVRGGVERNVLVSLTHA